MKAILITILILFTQAFGQGYEIPVKNSDNTILYKIENKHNNKTSYLFGSIHALCPEHMQYNDILEFLISKTDQVVLEIDMNEESNGLGNFEIPKSSEVKEIFNLNDNDVREFRKKLIKYFPHILERVPADELDAMVDFYLNQDVMTFFYLTLELMDIKCGVSEPFEDINANGVYDQGESFVDTNGNRKYDDGALTDGIEGFVIELLNQKGVGHGGLETEAERQMILSNSMKELSQFIKKIEKNNLGAELLFQLFEMQDELPKQINTMGIYYTLNDVVGMKRWEKELSKETDDDIWMKMDIIMEKAMLNDRERVWLPRMRSYMSGKSILFVVGMDHLEGLVPNLRRSGYTVTPLDIKAGLKKSLLKPNQKIKNYDNGDQYVGEFKNGKRHGHGTMTYSKNDEYGRDKYVGDWKDGYRHGHGTMTWTSGVKYVGKHKDGLRHGHGTLTWTDGTKYVGDWKDGVRHGHGTMTYSKNDEYGRDKYVGDWKDDDRHGHGTLTWTSGSKYFGEFKGARQGWGVMSESDGSFKIGIWFNDKLVESKEFSEVIKNLKRKYPGSEELKSF